MTSTMLPSHRAVMRLYARLGCRGVALRQYRLSVEALRRDLDTLPEAETTKPYREILHPTRPGRGV